MKLISEFRTIDLINFITMLAHFKINDQAYLDLISVEILKRSGLSDEHMTVKQTNTIVSYLVK